MHCCIMYPRALVHVGVLLSQPQAGGPTQNDRCFHLSDFAAS